MPGKPFVKGDARTLRAARRGGKAKKPRDAMRTLDYKAGYSAGWVACERFYRRAVKAA